MSAQFIIEYAGAPVRFINGQIELVKEEHADKFVSEPAAWFAAYRADLNLDRIQVVNAYIRHNHPAL